MSNELNTKSFYARSVKDIINNPVPFFVVTPVIIIISVLLAVGLSLLSAVFSGSIASSQGHGLLSGNPLPFIMGSLCISIIVSIIFSYVFTVLTNVASHVIYGREETLSGMFTSKTSFFNMFFNTWKNMLLVSILTVPLLFLAFGSYLLHNVGYTWMFMGAFFIMNIIAGSFLYWNAALHIYSNNINILSDENVNNTHIMRDNYMKIVGHEILLSLLFIIGTVIPFGVFFVIPFIMICRIYMVDSYVKNKYDVEYVDYYIHVDDVQKENNNKDNISVVNNIEAS